MVMRTIYFYFIFIFLSLFVFNGCGDKALFDMLAENSIKVIIKGTYASNNPRNWTGTFPDDTESVDDGTATYGDISEITANNLAPTLFMIDIAEMRIADDTGKHKQKFANYRKTFSISLNDDESFFNGEGVLYPNDDVRPDFYWASIRMYIRKMVFNSARKYYLDNDDDYFNGRGIWYYSEDFEVIFHEETVEGLDVNLLQVNTFYDSLKENATDINRVFPLSIPIVDYLIFEDDDDMVLEIRLVVKNFIKKYEYDSYSTYHYIYHYYALSDWLRNIREDETVIGGNIMAVARAYNPDKTATISGSGVPADRYVIAFNSNHTIDEFVAPDRNRPVCNDTTCCDPPKSPLDYVSGDIDSILDYYLNYEKYKERYNLFKVCVDAETDSYSSQWIAYNTRLYDFRLPPIATWSNSDGTYTLTNLPVGKTYLIYYSTTAPATGELPVDFTYHRTKAITAGDAGTTVFD